MRLFESDHLPQILLCQLEPANLEHLGTVFGKTATLLQRAGQISTKIFFHATPTGLFVELDPEIREQWDDARASLCALAPGRFSFQEYTNPPTGISLPRWEPFTGILHR